MKFEHFCHQESVLLDPAYNLVKWSQFKKNDIIVLNSKKIL